MTFTKRYLLPALPIVFSLIGTGIIISRLDTAELGEALNRVPLSYFLLSLLLAVLSQFLPARRWWVMLGRGGGEVYRACCTALFIGNFANAFMPLRMGELLRAALIRRREVISMSGALSSIILAQLMDIAAVLVLGLSVLLFAPLPPELVAGILLSGGVVIVGGLVLTVVARLNPAALPINRGWLNKLLNGIATGLNALKDRRTLIVTFGLTLAFWFSVAVMTWILLLPMSPSMTSASDGGMLLVYALAAAFGAGAGRMLPALPGDIGTVDFAVFFSLTALGVPEPIALAITLLTRLRYILTTLILGLGALWLESLNPFTVGRELEVKAEEAAKP